MLMTNSLWRSRVRLFKLADWEANQQIGKAGYTSALRPLIGGFPNWTVVYYVECDFVRVFVL